jgi:hypothetical protein
VDPSEALVTRALFQTGALEVLDRLRDPAHWGVLALAWPQTRTWRSGRYAWPPPTRKPGP